MACPQASYRPRKNRESPLYQLVRDHSEGLRQVYEQRFETSYGPWQAHWDKTLEEFVNCGDLHCGFARVYCESCRHEYLRAFSCQRRGFCPSCEARRRVLWAEHVTEEVLPDLPYRMVVFTIPRSLRRIFMRERELLGDLSRVAYESTREFLRAQFPEVDAVPYFVCTLHTWGDLAQIHPHAHALCSLGIRDREGNFYAAPEDLDFSPLEEIFRRRVLAMLREKERLSEGFYRTLLSWRHSGFSAHASTAVPAGDREALERVACYLLKPPISLGRLLYEPGSPTVVYKGKYNPTTRSNFHSLDAKEFLVLLLLHTPAPYEVRIRYYGAASSTARRGQAKPQQPAEAEEDHFRPPGRRSWARLLAKMYGADPLRCPSCGSRMRVLSVIEDEETIEKILKHLKLWDPPRAPPDKDDHPKGHTIEYDIEYNQPFEF